MAVIRARVTLKDIRTTGNRRIDNENLQKAFNRTVDRVGVKHQYKLREFYESPGEKRRRKKNESRSQHLKSKLRENFPRRDS